MSTSGSSKLLDFSSDDSVCDPLLAPRENDFDPQSFGQSLASSTGENPTPPKMIRLEEKGESHSENAGTKIIFNRKFFGEIKKVDDKKSDHITAVCQVCRKKLKGSVLTTSNFVKHLKKIHPETHQEYLSLKERMTPTSKSCSRIGITSSNRQERFDEKVLDYIIDTTSPLSVVERKSFQNLFEGTGLKVINRSKIKKLLNERHKSIVRNIKQNIATKKYFCTTVDIWSAKHRSFLGYTCHWLEAHDFKHKSVALACKRFTGKHSAERIADMISEINSEFGLSHLNIVATVTDNASNFVKAFKDFGIPSIPNPETEDEEFLSEDEDLPVCASAEKFYSVLPKHFRCASHTLNLVASTDFIQIIKTDESLHNRHNQAFQKCGNLWKKCSWPKSSEIVIQVLGESLITPVVTRWNSTYDAVNRILKHQSKLQDLCSSLSVSKFSKNDLDYLREYSIVMEPLATTLDFLQQEKKLLFGFLIPALVTLRVKLKKLLKSNDLLLLKNAASKLEESLVNRFQDYFALSAEANTAIVASVLCPSIKMKWLKALNVEEQHLSTDDVKTIVVQYARTLMDCECISLDEKDTGDETMQQQQESFFDFDDPDITTSLTSPDSTFSSAVHNDSLEILYLAYISDRDTNFDMLNKYPLLKRLSMKVNTPLTSSAPVERLFSLAGLVNAPRRRALSDDTFEQLVLLKANATWAC